MECGQAVHELDSRVTRLAQEGRVDLVRGEEMDAFVPDVLRLTHRHPNVGVDEVGAGDGFGGIVGDGDPQAIAEDHPGVRIRPAVGRQRRDKEANSSASTRAPTVVSASETEVIGP
jgi:hypothetical protein